MNTTTLHAPTGLSFDRPLQSYPMTVSLDATGFGRSGDIPELFELARRWLRSHTDATSVQLRLAASTSLRRVVVVSDGQARLVATGDDLAECAGLLVEVFLAGVLPVARMGRVDPVGERRAALVKTEGRWFRVGRNPIGLQPRTLANAQGIPWRRVEEIAQVDGTTTTAALATLIGDDALAAAYRSAHGLRALRRGDSMKPEDWPREALRQLLVHVASPECPLSTANALVALRDEICGELARMGVERECPCVEEVER